MKIIIDDYIQYSDAPDSLKSPVLADTYNLTTVTITLDESRTFDAIGVGNTTAATIDINGDTVTLGSSDKNGLYELAAAQTTDTVVVTLPAETTVGRLALGTARTLGASPAREPGFYSTETPRRTLSQQVVPGLGGVTGRVLSLDFRYKFTSDIFDDIENAYPTQIGRGFPFFMAFTKTAEQNRLPWVRFYGTTDRDWMLQSSVNRFLYSKKLKFREAF